MLAYLVREHNKTSQTRKILTKKTKKKKADRRVLKNVMQDQQGCKKNIPAEEERYCCTDETTRRRGRRYRHKVEKDRIPTTTKKPTEVLKNVMPDQNGFKKNNIRAEEQQINATRTKHEDEEEYTGVRPAGRENTRTKRETRQKEQNKQARQQVSLLSLSRYPH